MRILEQRVKLLLDMGEFSQFFKYHSDGRLLGSSVDLESDFETYFEGVGEPDLRRCFGLAVDELFQSLALPFHPNVRAELVFDLVREPNSTI